MIELATMTLLILGLAYIVGIVAVKILHWRKSQ